MATMTYQKGTLYNLSIIDLKPDPNQPRKSMDQQALDELVESIKRNGIIQPLLFRVAADSPYLIIVAGERRYKAAQKAGLLIIPGICVEGNAAEIALIENVQRQDLTCIEEAEALKRLMDEEKYTQDQLAAAIGKPRATINDSISLTNLPQEIRDQCRGDRTVGKKKLVEISRKKQQRSMTTAYAKYKEELQKEQAGGTKRAAGAPPVVSLCQSIDNTRQKLEKTDIADWTDSDLLSVNDALNNLKAAIETFINPPPSSNLA
ncbi:MAG: ParB/RepB/Spo0J family partition protein [Syntrophales bacterium]